LQDEVDRLLTETRHDLSKLPNPPSSEPVSEILKLIGTFVLSIKDLVEGIPDENGLIQKLRGPREEFKKAIRYTAPYFLPLERSQAVDIAPIPPPFLSDEEEWEEEPCDSSSPIFINDVLESATS